MKVFVFKSAPDLKKGELPIGTILSGTAIEHAIVQIRFTEWNDALMRERIFNWIDNALISRLVLTKYHTISMELIS